MLSGTSIERSTRQNRKRGGRSRRCRGARGLRTRQMGGAVAERPRSSQQRTRLLFERSFQRRSRAESRSEEHVLGPLVVPLTWHAPACVERWVQSVRVAQVAEDWLELCELLGAYVADCRLNVWVADGNDEFEGRRRDMGSRGLHRRTNRCPRAERSNLRRERRE